MESKNIKIPLEIGALRTVPKELGGNLDKTLFYLRFWVAKNRLVSPSKPKSKYSNTSSLNQKTAILGMANKNGKDSPKSTWDDFCSTFEQ